MKAKKYTGTEIVTMTRPCSRGSAGTKGDCYSLSVQGIDVETRDQNCMSISVYDKPCFYIKCEEEYDVLTTPPDEVDLLTLGFTAIKCIAGHGVDEFVVIGKYQETELDPEQDVIAKISYETSLEGGIGKVNDITYMVTLDDLCILLDEADKILYDDIDYLDCYDITTGLSDLAIVTTSHVYWIEPVLLSISGTSIGHTNEAQALAHPFYLEDTYGSDTWTRTITANCNSVPYVQVETYCGSGSYVGVMAWIECDEGCISGAGQASWYPSPIIQSATAADTRTLTYSISDGSDNQLDIGGSLLTRGPGAYNTLSLPSSYGTGSVTAMRGNVAILNDRLVSGEIPSELLSSTEGCYVEDASQGYSETACSGLTPAGGETFFRVRALYWGVFFQQSKYNALYELSTPPINSRGLCSDGLYMALYNNSGIEYVSVDGSKNGTISGNNFTLMKGVLLTVDGTSTISQTVLNDIP